MYLGVHRGSWPGAWGCSEGWSAVLDQAELVCPHERLGAALDRQFAVEVIDMSLDRADGDDQRVGDILV